MTNILSLTSEKDEAASADTTYPIMVYILLTACPRRLVSNLKYPLSLIQFHIALLELQ